jgi:hypothetical protein
VVQRTRCAAEAVAHESHPQRVQAQAPEMNSGRVSNRTLIIVLVILLLAFLLL